MTALLDTGFPPAMTNAKNRNYHRVLSMAEQSLVLLMKRVARRQTIQESYGIPKE